MSIEVTVLIWERKKKGWAIVSMPNIYTLHNKNCEREGEKENKQWSVIVLIASKIIFLSKSLEH